MSEKYVDYGGIRAANGKLYLAEFRNRKTGDSFLKIGVTSEFDAAKRFLSEEYSKWEVKILASAYGTKEQVEEAEKKLLREYPKNFWLKEKIRGVTEIVKLDSENRFKAIQKVRKYAEIFAKTRETNAN